MLPHWISYLTEGTVYAGMEIHDTDGKVCYHYVELHKKKGELHLSKTTEVSDLGEFAKSFKNTIPLFWAINTSKVLLKMVKSPGTTQPEALVHAAFPNLDLNNFYYQIIQWETHPIVAIAKKEYVDGLIREWEDLGMGPFNLSLGIGSLVHSLPFLETDQVQTSNFELTLREGSIGEMKPITRTEHEEYTINGLRLPARGLLSFSQILGGIQKDAADTNFGNSIKQFQNKLSNRRLFNFGLRAALGFFVGILLTNFLVFDHYRTEIGRLQADLETNTAQEERMLELQALVQGKKERVETLKAVPNSKSTLYMDQIAHSLPDPIVLDRMNYCPLDKPVRESKPILLQENTLLVSGMSKDVTAFSKWLEQLEQWNWISKVETLDYDFISKDISNFLIKIELHATGQEK